MRVDLAGGVERLAEALSNGARDARANRITKLTRCFGARGSAAERRLASLARALDLPFALNPQLTQHQPLIRLDPRDGRDVWIDKTFNVAWNVSVEEVRAVIEN
jgi:predicted transcriptional regulator of viral defense system